jgi:hypothetical protein
LATPVPTTRLTVTTTVVQRCGSIGGCAAYVTLIPAGATDPVEIELRGRGFSIPALQPVIGKGAYVIRFRLAAVSDERVVGQPAEETTIATCEVPIHVDIQEAVDVSVTFEKDSCNATATYTVEIID